MCLLLLRQLKLSWQHLVRCVVTCFTSRSMFAVLQLQGPLGSLEKSECVPILADLLWLTQEKTSSQFSVPYTQRSISIYSIYISQQKYNLCKKTAERCLLLCSLQNCRRNSSNRGFTGFTKLGKDQLCKREKRISKIDAFEKHSSICTNLPNIMCLG